MSHIEREIVINRPVEEVFDFLADGRNEPHYNPHMLRAEQTSAGPVGPGTQFRTEVTNNGRSMEMVYEITAYERPQRLAGRTIKGPIDVQSTETFDSVPGGTHFRWVMELESRGLFKLISPLVARMMGRNLDTLLANIKRLLEAEPPPLVATASGIMTDTKQTTRRLPPWSPWRPRTGRPRHGWHPRHPGAVIAAIKAIHTLIWFSIEACMVYLLYAGFAKRSDRRAVVAAAVVSGECLIFAASGFRCPLTQLTDSLGTGSGSVTDIFLPEWFAHNLPAIHAPLLILAAFLNGRNLRQQRKRRSSDANG
jgi:uncharacterized protein YndB with AHSA1/START domain